MADLHEHPCNRCGKPVRCDQPHPPTKTMICIACMTRKSGGAAVVQWKGDRDDD